MNKSAIWAKASTKPSESHAPRFTEHDRPAAPAPPAVVVQRRLGNQGIRQLLGAIRLQPKLTVSDPNDVYEQEADRVMRMSGVATGIDRTATPQIYRLFPTRKEELRRQPLEEEEEPLQAKPLVPGWTVQRQGPEEEEEFVQPKSKSDGTPEITAEAEATINGLPGYGYPLPDAIRSFMEPRFNADFSAVRVHTDDHANDLARAVNAQAFTIGRDVVFATGRDAPETERRRHLLAHELTHVVQQGALLPRTWAPRVTPSPRTLQRGPARTEAGRFALGIAAEDQRYLRTVVVRDLRASGDPIHVNTADAIDQGLLSLDVLTRHPEPAEHTSEDVSSGTYFFPGTDLNTVIQSTISTGGGANVPGAPANRIYVLVRWHFSDPPPASPTRFFRRIVHEAQHYLDHHADEVRARGTVDREVFRLWLGYKTEFNAYWTDGSYDYYPVTPVGRPADDPRRPLRWEAIRDFLMTTAPYRARFRWLWFGSPPPAASNPTGRWRTRMYPLHHDWFRDRIEGYHEPEAFNRLNSPRIEQLFSALAARPVRPTAVNMAVAALDTADLAEIRTSTRFQALVRERLGGRFRREIMERLGLAVAPP